MARNKAAWGIEVGSNAIKAIRLEREGDSVVVRDFAVVPFAQVLATPDVDSDTLVREALVQFVQARAEQLAKDPIVISIPGHLAFARFAKLPPVEPKKIPDIVRFEAVQQIPFPIDQVEWDYQTFQSAGDAEVEVGIFAVTKDRIQQRLALYAEAGLRPEAITLSPLALFNAVSYDLSLGDKHRPVVLLDIGTVASDLIVAEDGRCWVRTFPVGGTHFTDALASAFERPYKVAERLKREGAASKHARQIMHAMKEVFEHLLDEIRRSRGYYETLHRENPLDTMYAVGSTLKIPGLRKFIGLQLQVEVHRLDEFKRIRVEGKQAADFSASCVNLATAYGLALQGLGMAKISVNLTPVHAVREKVWRSKTPWFAAAACFVVLASGLLLVRPLLGRGAIDRAGEPSVVAEIIRVGDGYAEEYRRIEATASVGETAQNMLNLVDWRSVWPQLVNDSYAALAAPQPQSALVGSDVGAILAIPATERKLISLRDLSSRYIFSKDTNKRQIAVTMEIEISQPDQTRFINDREKGLRTWFQSNAVRPGVPYTIIESSVITPGDSEWTEVLHKADGTTAVKGPSEPGMGGGSADPASGSAPASGGDDPFGGAGSGASRGRGGAALGGSGGGGEGGGGGGGGGGGMMQGRRTGNEYTDPQGQGQQQPIDGGDSARRRPRDQPPPSGAAILADSAIPPAPSLFKDGDKTYRGKVGFTIEIVDPKAPAAAPEGQTQ